MSLRSRAQSEVKERSDDGSGELLPYPDGEAHGASDAADFFGVGAGIDQSSDLLQICRGERAIDFKNPSERVKKDENRDLLLRWRVEVVAETMD